MVDPGKDYEWLRSSILSKVSQEDIITAEEPAHQKSIHKLAKKKARVDIMLKTMMSTTCNRRSSMTESAFRTFCGVLLDLS